MAFFYIFIVADAIFASLLTGKYISMSWISLWLWWYIVEQWDVHFEWITWISKSITSYFQGISLLSASPSNGMRMGTRVSNSLYASDLDALQAWSYFQLVCYYSWMCFVCLSTFVVMTRSRGLIHTTLSRWFGFHRRFWESMATEWIRASPFADVNRSLTNGFHSCMAVQTFFYLFVMYVWMETLENMYPCHEMYHEGLWILVWFECWLSQRLEWVCIAWPLESKQTSIPSGCLSRMIVHFWYPFTGGINGLIHYRYFGNLYLELQQSAMFTQYAPPNALREHPPFPGVDYPSWWFQIPWLCYWMEIPNMSAYYQQAWISIQQARK